MATLRGPYSDRRMLALLPLAFASGLPYLLTAGTLQAWMTGVGIDLKSVGYASLIGLPFALKFLWAPLMDRYVPPLMGRRRGWLLIAQLLIVLAIVAMAWTGPGQLRLFAVFAVALALASASQDIVGDAYRVDLLPPRQRGAGAAVWVMGYRIGLAASGVGAMYCVGRYGMRWETAYFLLAGLMGVGIAGSFLAPEPRNVAPPPRTLVQSAWIPLKAFLLKPEGWLVIAFVLVFKIPEFLADTMTIPFLKKIGVTEDVIGLVRMGFGTVILIIGTTVGGAMVARMSLRKCLWICGILHGISNLSYLLLVHAGPSLPMLFIVVAIEYFIIGLTTAAFVAFLTGHCDSRYSATQYALLSGLMALSRVAAGTPSGWIAEHVGWNSYFLISMATMSLGLLLLPWTPMTRAEKPGRLPNEPLPIAEDAPRAR
jgi:MFS transporter, PAT family, beta-lactamase induction signal transducer AmpG